MWVTRWRFSEKVLPQSYNTIAIIVSLLKTNLLPIQQFKQNIRPHSHLTNKRTISWMDTWMSQQMVLQCKALFAFLALIWSTKAEILIVNKSNQAESAQRDKLYLSVEWSSKCVFKQCLWAKSLPQCMQTCGRSPVNFQWWRKKKRIMLIFN